MIISDIISRYGVPAIAIVGLVLVFSFVILWILRFFEYKKVKGSMYFSNQTLSLIEHGIIYIILMILCIASIWLLSWASHIMQHLYDSLLKFTPTLVIVFMILLVTFIIVSIVHRMFEYFKGNLTYKPKKVLNSSFTTFIELPVEYMIYFFGFIIAMAVLFVSISIHSGTELDLVSPIVNLFQNNMSRVVLIVVLALVFYLAYRFIDGFLGDVKAHSTRTNPQLIELMRGFIKYPIFVIGSAIIIFIILDMVGLPYVGWIVFAIVLFFVALAIILLVASPFRNSISGLMLMMTEPYDKGDIVKLLDDTACEIVTMGLMFTVVKCRNGNVMEIPNNEIVDHKIINYSRRGSLRIKVQVEFPPDIERTKIIDMLLKSAIETDGISDTNPHPKVFLKSVTPSISNYELSANIIDLRKEEEIRSNLLISIQEILKREGIKYQSIKYTD